jgi:hypothetical protein
VFHSATGAVVPGDGSGETIALIEADHDPNLASDLQVFDQANGLVDPRLTVVDQAGARTNATWASEETLDVEWAHAIAPGAGILVVEARSPDLTDLLVAVDTARNTPGVAAISMSWGFNELPFETSYDAHFTTPAGHQGITFVASSGDFGASAGAEYPASSPNVLAVGGTTLKLTGRGNYISETVWNGSGRGDSRYEGEPSYQDPVQARGRRRTPDVVFDGNPKTGVAVYQSPLDGGPGTWQRVGGTSLGAPAWAAIIAIVDQGRALAGAGSFDGPTQTLPALYSLPASDFHPVATPPPTSASASSSGGGFKLFGFLPLPLERSLLRHPSKAGIARSVASARKGTAMGLGSPDGPALIADLVASHASIPMNAAPEDGGLLAASRAGPASIRASGALLSWLAHTSSKRKRASG